MTAAEAGADSALASVAAAVTAAVWTANDDDDDDDDGSVSIGGAEGSDVTGDGAARAGEPSAGGEMGVVDGESGESTDVGKGWAVDGVGWAAGVPDMLGWAAGVPDLVG